MRVPVLVVLPGQDVLRASARAAVEGSRPVALTKVKKPSKLRIDTRFTAVPLGSGRPKADASLESMAPETSETFAVRAFVEAKTAQDIPEESEGHAIFSDPHIANFLTCIGSGPVGNHSAVANKLDVAKLASKNLDGSDVALAILDTGINLQHLTSKLGWTPKLDATNSWTPAGITTKPGAHPVDHGTMCAFDALIAAPNATLLDFPILSGNAPGGAMVGRTLSVALMGFAQLLAFWAVAFAPGSNYRALVCSNSWGIFHPSWDFPQGHPGRFIDNPKHPFNIIVATLAASGVDIVFAAGNCGVQCPDSRCQNRTTQAIMGTSAHDDVLTLAGCDINDQRVGYSSQGPSIPGINQQKPDIITYTHFLGSEAFGASTPDSGTSAACPVAAGCVAALRSRVSPRTTSSAAMIQSLKTTARKVGGSAPWNGDYGFGILDPVAAGKQLGVI